MKILLASADTEELRWAAERQWTDGVFTTPSLMARGAAAEEGLGQLADASRITGGPVYAAVHSVHADEMYQEARELARATEQTVVVLPLIEDAVPCMRRLTAEGVQVAANFVHSSAQALLAAKAGAIAVIVPFTEHESFGQSGFTVLQEIRSVLDSARLECDLVAWGLRSSSDVSGCAAAGVDAIVLGPEALRTFLVHPLTDRGVDGFLGELARIPRQRSH